MSNNMENERSILTSIGSDITGIMSPVSICMFLVVLIVYSISISTPQTPIITAANLVYNETSSDSTLTKLQGALLNAIVFIALITFVTFLLVLLYYYNFTGFLKHYTRFSAFFVLGSMGGSILLSIIQKFSIPVDVVTFSVLLFNFTIVGVFSVFARSVPIVVKQGYMVVLGIIVAVWFTKLPEWTTWVLLVFLAVYDLVAVLAPGGPLKILLDLSSSRNEELPALVYEARPNVLRNANVMPPVLGLFVAMASNETGSVELQQVSRRDDMVIPEQTAVDIDNSGNGGVGSLEIEIDDERSPLVENVHERGSRMMNDDHVENSSLSDSDVEDSILRDNGIRLGLGDFVFYSVLVGRAAMYDLMTVYACYLAIICGLGCTLTLLAVFRRALPALPISIMLGITFYFLTRLLMEPFVVGTSTNLMMF